MKKTSKTKRPQNNEKRNISIRDLVVLQTNVSIKFPMFMREDSELFINKGTIGRVTYLHRFDEKVELMRVSFNISNGISLTVQISPDDVIHATNEQIVCFGV